MRYLRNRVREQKGFTLVELIVVVAILGILAIIVTPRVLQAMEQARDNSALAFGKEIQLAMERYLLQNGEYPPEPAGLEEELDDYVTINKADIDVKEYTLGDNYELVIQIQSLNREVKITPESVRVEKLSNG